VVVAIKAEALKDIEEAIEKLRKSEKLVVVEGMKDRRSLAKLGLKNIVTLKKPLYAVVDEIAETAKECAILTDLDSEGRKLYSILRKELQKQGVKIDDKLRNLLFRHTPLKCVEGLASFLENNSKQKDF